MRLALLLDDLLIRFGRRHSQPPGQQEIARIAGGYVHHLAARAQFVDIFPQYDVHNVSPVQITAAKGSSAILRAFLIASVSRRWHGPQTPEMRRGTILPRSAMNALSILTSL